MLFFAIAATIAAVLFFLLWRDAERRILRKDERIDQLEDRLHMHKPMPGPPPVPTGPAVSGIGSNRPTA